MEYCFSDKSVQLFNLRSEHYMHEPAHHTLYFKFSEEMLAILKVFPISDKKLFLSNLDEQVLMNALYSWELNLVIDYKREQVGNHLFWRSIERSWSFCNNGNSVQVQFNIPFEMLEEDWQRIRNAVVDSLLTVKINSKMALQI